MSKDKRYIPNLKFEEFNNNGEWTSKKFSKIVTRISTTSDNKSLPRIEYEDIISSRGTLNKDVYRKDSIKKGIEFQSQDILFGKLRPYLKNWLFPDFAGIAVGDFWVFRSSDTNPKFIYSLIQTERYQRISNLSTGTKMPRSDWNIVSNTNFIIPKSMKEQQKIGSFFEKIDKMIQVQQSKVNKVKDIKSAYLSEMFPKEGEKYPKKRFEGFTEPWKLTKFMEIAEVERGLTYHPTDIVEKGGVRVLRSSNIYEDTFITKDDDVFVNENAINIEFSNEKNILITSANGSSRLVGKHAILEQLDTPSVHGGFMLLVRTARPYFLNASMSSDWYRKFIRYNVAGGGGSIGNIKKSDLEHQLIYIPSKEEQEKIGQFFKNLDNQISIEEEKLRKLRKLKRAYLNDMFV